VKILATPMTTGNICGHILRHNIAQKLARVTWTFWILQASTHGPAIYTVLSIS